MHSINEIISDGMQKEIHANKSRLIFHQPAFVVMTTRGSFAMVRVTGFEPAA